MGALYRRRTEDPVGACPIFILFLHRITLQSCCPTNSFSFSHAVELTECGPLWSRLPGEGGEGGGSNRGEGFERDSRDIQGENRPYNPRPPSDKRTEKWIGHHTAQPLLSFFVLPGWSGGDRGRVRPPRGKGGGRHGVRGCLGRRFGPGTWLAPRYFPWAAAPGQPIPGIGVAAARAGGGVSLETKPDPSAPHRGGGGVPGARQGPKWVQHGPTTATSPPHAPPGPRRRTSRVGSPYRGSARRRSRGGLRAGRREEARLIVSGVLQKFATKGRRTDV